MLLIDDVLKLTVKQHCHGRYYKSDHGYWRCSTCDTYVHHLVLPSRGTTYVDHINGNKDDCRSVNLRYSSPSASAFNRGIPTGKYLRGVARKSSGMYYAKITVNKKQFYLGQAYTEQAAHKLYLSACLKFYGEYPRGCSCIDCGGQAHDRTTG